MNKAIEEEEKLAKFEGEFETNEEEDFVEVFNEEEGAKLRITTTLKEHVKHWEDTGASNFCLSVIRDGFRMKLEGLEEEPYGPSTTTTSTYSPPLLPPL